MTTKTKTELPSSNHVGERDASATIEEHIRSAIQQANAQKRGMLAYLLGMALQQLIDEEIIHHYN